jgi:hypothetical protein
VDGAGEAVEGELAAVLIEQDVGTRHGHIVAGCFDDAPSASPVTLETMAAFLGP